MPIVEQNTQIIGEDQKLLKAKLLNASLSIEGFINGLQKLDHRTPQRLDAEANSAVLSDDMVKSFVYEHGTEIEIANYHMAIGFAEFHIGQEELLRKNDIEKGLVHMRESLRQSTIAAPEEIFAYKRATIAYLENNLKELLSYENDISIVHENNRKIILNFIKGLKKRGYPYYGEDYTTQDI